MQLEISQYVILSLLDFNINILKDKFIKVFFDLAVLLCISTIPAAIVLLSTYQDAFCSAQ